MNITIVGGGISVPNLLYIVQKKAMQSRFTFQGLNYMMGL